MKKHKILFLLAFAIFVVIMAFSVSASSEKDGIYYDLNDNTMEATVSADNRTKCTLEKVVIPSTVEIGGKTYTVTKFAASAFGALNSGNTTLKEITIPYTVTT